MKKNKTKDEKMAGLDCLMADVYLEKDKCERQAAPIQMLSDMSSSAPESKTTAAAIQEPVVVEEGVPSFQTVIKGQSSEGFWDSSSREVLAKRIDGDTIEDVAVRQALVDAGLTAESQERAYLTLLALFILEEVFIEKENEWQMIAQNAKKFLEKVGLAKPATLTRKFSLMPLFD